MATQLKAYDIHGRLWISKPAPHSQILILMRNLNEVNPLTVAYLKEGVMSKKVVFPPIKPKTGSVRYVGSDGITSRTIPSRLSAYPVTVIPAP